MEITIDESMIGKKLKSALYCEFDYVLCTGVRSNTGDIYLYGVGVKDGKVVREHTPGMANGLGRFGWELFDKSEAALPPDIEPLMKEFGCHEKQTRALVAAILKQIKGK